MSIESLAQVLTDTERDILNWEERWLWRRTLLRDNILDVSIEEIPRDSAGITVCALKRTVQLARGIM